MSHSEIELDRSVVNQVVDRADSMEKKDAGVLSVEQPVDVDRENDAVFGHLEGGVNYRGLGFWGASALLIKTQIGVGVLSFPFTLQVLGLIPGLLCFFAIAAITTWSDLVIGDFKNRHKELYGLDDIGFLLFGRIGRSVFSVGVVVWLLIAGGLGVSSISVALNGISGHGACTAIFMAVAGILTFGISSIQTLSRLSWLGIVGATSIVVAVMTLTIAVGLQDRPDAAPATGPWDKDFLLIGNPTVAEATAALGSIVYTLCGTPAFIPVVSEMKDPRMYKRAVIVCQSVIIFLNFLVGTIVYYFCGQYVTSPAPGSAGPLLKKITYGLALPGVIMGCVVLVHFVSKYVFVRWMAGSRHLAARTWQHWAAWLTCTAGCSLIAYIIASAVPVFSVLTAMGGAFLGPFVSCQPYGALWLKDNWVSSDARSRRWWISAGWAIFVIVAGCFLQVAGTYGSIVETINAFKVGGTKPFTCSDNSGSV